MALTRWPRGFHGLVPVTLLVVVVMVLITSFLILSSDNRWGFEDTPATATRMRDCYRGLQKEYYKEVPRDTSPEAENFRRKAWRLTAAVVRALDKLHVLHWLGSGSLLGFARQCDIVPSMGDVDIEIAVESLWKQNITVDHLLKTIRAEGPRLKLLFGRPEDSLEMTLVDDSGTKLDLFFSYPDANGTRFTNGMDSGTLERYKWPYPDFELCWSLLDGLRIGIPCEPNHYLRIAYGPDWASPPQKKWDYRTGRFNVVRNGYWPEEMRDEVFQTFEV
ncbi:fukutin-like [Amphibalanus amphitrite]|uniref:fukutin-like n=1 Tax=Amphibalanus amphitrite TaxID=1232801 RepID=UPI001C8FAF40|nr:fukutin-like [Amphibalanus amphitrite]